MTLKKTQTRQSIEHKLFKITSSLVLFLNLNIFSKIFILQADGLFFIIEFFFIIE